VSTVPATNRTEPSPGRPAPRRALAALVAILAAIVIGIIGLLASPASAASLPTARNAVAPIHTAISQRVGPHEPVLAGQRRARAPNYDQTVVGHCVGAETAAPDLANLSTKITRQMEQRGWTSDQIQNAFDNGEPVNAINKATGGAATRYINPETGQSVVIDNSTGEVIHVGGPGFQYGPGSGDAP
jgi:hypothetical protein